MPTLQDALHLGLSEVSPELRPHAEAVLAAAKAGHLDALTGEDAAAALVMCTADDAGAMLDAQLGRDPAVAFDLALRACRLHLRFALVQGKLARVLERPTRKPSSTLPPPDFWLRLRRALDGAPALFRPRARQLALGTDLSDLRLRAPVAFVVPDEPSLWTPAHLAQVHAALDFLDPVEANLYLLGVLRSHPWAAKSPTWPPPLPALRKLPEDVLEAALALAGDHRALSRLAEEREAQEAAADPTPLLDQPLESHHLATLSRVVPDAKAITLATGRLAHLTEVEATLVRALATGWILSAPEAADAAAAHSAVTAGAVGDLRRAAFIHLPPGCTVPSPWDAPRPKRTKPLAPPPAPPPARGRWAQDWVARAFGGDAGVLRDTQHRLRTGAFLFLPPDAPRAAFEAVFEAWKGGRAPDEYCFAEVVEALGPSTLPFAAAWTRKNGLLLPAVSFIDDGLLAPSWALALSSRRRPVQEAARAWLDAHPRLGADGALALLLSGDDAERRLGQRALRWLEARHGDAARAAQDALTNEQRAWVDAARAEAPSLPAKTPPLPAFVKVDALPGVATRDATARLDDAGLRTLLALAKASTLDDAEPLLAAAAPLAPDSLAGLAGAVFTAWLTAGGSPKERWAMELLAHFPSDTWARVLGGLCQSWAQEGFPSRAQDAVEVLARMPSRLALLEVHRLSTKIRTAGLKAKATQAFEDAAQRLGLSQEELEDRLVPDFGLTGGRALGDGVEVDLDDDLKPVLRREGKTLKTPPASLGEAGAAAWAAVKKGKKHLEAAARRLERLMAEGRALPALHFTEVWLMHPLLSRLSERVAWVAFSGETRTVFLTAPLRTWTGVPFTLLESMTVRPVHRLELSAAELEALQGALPAPPFPQLGREVYPSADVRAALRERVGTEVTAAQLIGLERLGWARGPVVGGGCYVSVERRGPHWRVLLVFEPGVYLGDPSMNARQVINDVLVDAPGAIGKVAASELLRTLQFPSTRRRGAP
ncbi:MAG: DUF4132 domain-containing protein [Myxococcales bacterium]|nr:DUF4132 domain-containing protein [Myxococcales bacterium]